MIRWLIGWYAVGFIVFLLVFIRAMILGIEVSFRDFLIGPVLGFLGPLLLLVVWCYLVTFKDEEYDPEV